MPGQMRPLCLPGHRVTRYKQPFPTTEVRAVTQHTSRQQPKKKATLCPSGLGIESCLFCLAPSSSYCPIAGGVPLQPGQPRPKLQEYQCQHRAEGGSLSMSLTLVQCAPAKHDRRCWGREWGGPRALGQRDSISSRSIIRLQA